MKILHIIGQLGIGGGEKQLYELIKNSSDKLEHQVMYFNDSNDTEAYKLFEKANINFSRIPRNKIRPFKFLRDFSNAIKDANPDIVHCWLYSANIWGRLAAILAGHKKIIVAYRGGHLAYCLFLRILEFFTAGKVHHLANSLACADMTARKTGVNPAKYDVIYNGVDIERFNVPSIKEQLKKQCNIPNDAKIITMVGRLTESKNHFMLLKIAKKIKQENLNCHFLIVGHGELESYLKRTAFELNVEKIVHFLGLRHNVPAMLKSSDIFLYTTLFEGFPNALAEAMTAGLPIVATNFEGADEVLTNGKEGRIIKINDINSAVAAIEYYINNPEYAELIGKAAKEKIINYLSIAKMVENTMKYYERILNEIY